MKNSNLEMIASMRRQSSLEKRDKRFSLKFPLRNLLMINLTRVGADEAQKVVQEWVEDLPL